MPTNNKLPVRSPAATNLFVFCPEAIRSASMFTFSSLLSLNLRRQIKRRYEAIGWEYLRKARMSPQIPRPSNAKGASPEREAFKKVSR